MRNKLLPRLAAALALLPPIVGAAAFLSAAWAQVPPPVPALPDTQRSTSYSITATTCACSVGFALFGDSTDVDAWIEVWIAGVRYLSTDPTFGWSLSSATGTLATIPRPITNAVLTFNAAQTGTVQIVGARRPRRTSQFQENRGVAARDLNQAITDLVAVERELWDKSGRSILVPPGEVIKQLPPAATRSLGVFIFDSLGNPAITPIGGASLTVVGPTGTTAKTAIYSAVTGDCGKEITLAGSSFYTLTVGAPGGFALNCFIAINNLDATRGKSITISGMTTFILWPGQTFTLFNSNGTWIYVNPPPSRWRLTAGTTIFVDPTLGSDSNDGLASGSGALLTVQKAWDNSADNLDLAGQPLLIQLADGNYTVGITSLKGMVGQTVTTNLAIKGNAISPTNVSFVCSGTCFSFGAGGGASVSVFFQHMSVQTTSGGNGFQGFTSNTAVRVDDIWFGNVAGHAIACAHGAECSVASIAHLRGNLGASFANAQTGGRFVSDGSTLSVDNSIVNGLALYATADQGSIFAGLMTFINPGLVNGQKYSCSGNAIINTGATGNINYFPGTVAGASSTGCQYN